MGYSLGIDLGAATCVVALQRAAAAEVCRIGEDDSGMPAVALMRPGGSVLVGEEADARSEYEPALVARYVVSRLGDGQAIDIDGHVLDPLAMTRALLREAMERAAPPPGVGPDHVVVTYPLLPVVGPEELIADAAAEEFGPNATLVPAPVAAVARLAAERGLGDDSVVAVIDVGGSSVDVALVRRTPTAFDLVGDPATLADLGGVDLDGAVLSLVEGAIGDVSSMVRPGDSAGMLALRRLRASCRAAKERLSIDRSAVVEVAMPNARGRVEITRDAFERTIEPALVETVDLVRSVIDGAGLIPDDLRAIVVTGGSARIPRVTELLEQQTGLPILVEERPEATVALGAVLFSDVADDLAGIAAGAPGPVSGPVSGPADGVRANDGAAALGLGAGLAGAVGAVGAGLSGAAAGAAEGDDAGLPLTGIDSIPLIGPTAGGGPLPWEDTHPHNAGGAELPAGDPGAPTDATPAPAADWGGPSDPWTSGSVSALPAADDPWRAPPLDSPGAHDAWPAAPRGDDPWTDRGPRTQDEARGWDDWGSDSTTVFAATAGAGALAAGRSQDVEWGQTSDDEVRRLTTSDTDPFGRSGTLSSRLRSRSEGSEEEDDDDDGGGFDVRLLVGGLLAAVGVLIIGGYFVLATSSGGDDPAVAVADTSDTTSSPTTSTSTTTTVPPTTVAPTTETTEPPTTTSTARPRTPSTTTTVPPTTEPPTTTVPPTTEPPTTTPPPTGPPSTGPPTTPPSTNPS